MKMLAISCASETSPPPLSRRSKIEPPRPAMQLALDRFANFAMGPGLKVAERDHPQLDPVNLGRERGDDRL